MPGSVLDVGEREVSKAALMELYLATGGLMVLLLSLYGFRCLLIAIAVAQGLVTFAQTDAAASCPVLLLPYSHQTVLFKSQIHMTKFTCLRSFSGSCWGHKDCGEGCLNKRTESTSELSGKGLNGIIVMSAGGTDRKVVPSATYLSISI